MGLYGCAIFNVCYFLYFLSAKQTHNWMKSGILYLSLKFIYKRKSSSLKKAVNQKHILGFVFFLIIKTIISDISKWISLSLICLMVLSQSPIVFIDNWMCTKAYSGTSVVIFREYHNILVIFFNKYKSNE